MDEVNLASDEQNALDWIVFSGGANSIELSKKLNKNRQDTDRILNKLMDEGLVVKNNQAAGLLPAIYSPNPDNQDKINKYCGQITTPPKKDDQKPDTANNDQKTTNKETPNITPDSPKIPNLEVPSEKDNQKQDTTNTSPPTEQNTIGTETANLAPEEQDVLDWIASSGRVTSVELSKKLKKSNKDADQIIKRLMDESLILKITQAGGLLPTIYSPNPLNQDKISKYRRQTSNESGKDGKKQAITNINPPINQSSVSIDAGDITSGGQNKLKLRLSAEKDDQKPDKTTINLSANQGTKNDETVNLTTDEKDALNWIVSSGRVTSEKLSKKLNKNNKDTNRILKKLTDEGLVVKNEQGAGLLPAIYSPNPDNQDKINKYCGQITTPPKKIH